MSFFMIGESILDKHDENFDFISGLIKESYIEKDSEHPLFLHELSIDTEEDSCVSLFYLSTAKTTLTSILGRLNNLRISRYNSSSDGSKIAKKVGVVKSATLVSVNKIIRYVAYVKELE